MLLLPLPLQQQRLLQDAADMVALSREANSAAAATMQAAYDEDGDLVVERRKVSAAEHVVCAQQQLQMLLQPTVWALMKNVHAC